MGHKDKYSEQTSKLHNVTLNDHYFKEYVNVFSILHLLAFATLPFAFFKAGIPLNGSVNVSIIFSKEKLRKNARETLFLILFKKDFQVFLRVLSFAM